ncbi:MAG: hypothetical protein VKI42_02410 [Synechococcaceae cyanobacterium]|nr:hypothetical protein [Synechococcaceae cyanobacterium]
MTFELCDRRILGAVRCIDAVTGLPVSSALRITAKGVRMRPGRAGLVVIQDAQGWPSLAEITSSFEQQPSAAPAGESWPETLTLFVQDPLGHYLSRTALISLPRVPSRGAQASLFTPITLLLYPSPMAPVRAAWAVLRVTVLATTPGGGSARRLPWAWMRLRLVEAGQPSSPPLTQALADWRGEALLILRSLPLGFGASGTRIKELSGDVEVVFDPNLETLPESLTALEPPEANKNYWPDPDFLDGSDARLRDGFAASQVLVAGRDPPARLLVNLQDRSP